MTRRPRARAAVGLLLFGGTAVACHEILGIDEFTKGVEPPTVSATCAIEELVPNVERIDLLFAVDNSRGMADKAAVLALSVPGLLADLVNPPCLNPDGVPANASVGPLDPCPLGTERTSQPVLDVHIGVISSSLGDYGGDVCPTEGSAGFPGNDDRAHLLSRGPGGSIVPTYQGMGFLRWDPASTEPGVVSEFGQLVERTTELILGAGAEGCGFEAQMEAWYRFLVDPSPYDTIEIVENRIHHVGEDQALLDQRSAFLRGDSLVVVVMLTDENDCSVEHDEGSQSHVMATNTFSMPRPASVCATAPDDPCCYACPLEPPEGCVPDPACDALGPFLTPQEDPVNLRCWDQKRRFGVDFLYPPERYVRALTEAEIDPDAADLAPTAEGRAVPNPLFAEGRPRGLVLLAGVVGVPVQTIARRNATGEPDLLLGLDAEGKPVGGFMSPAELTANGVWPLLLGSPADGVPPGDPYMIETPALREGTHPVSLDDMVAFSEFEEDGTVNPINGFEYDMQGVKLQYACIHPIGTPRDCSTDPDPSCCVPGVSDPTCQDMANPLLQTFSPARPAVRELEVMRALQEQAALGSICRLGEPGEANFGYTPVLASLADRLQTPIGSRCLTQSFPVDDPDTAPPCVVVEARVDDACDCPAPTRAPLGPLGTSVRDRALADAPGSPWSCFCEIAPVTGLELALCLDNPATEPTQGGEIIHGWCYIDGNLGLGDPSLADACASRRRLRLLGDAQPADGATLLVGCEAESAGTCDGAP